MAKQKDVMVYLFAETLTARVAFEQGHAERILNYSDVWVLDDDNFEFTNNELKARTKDTSGTGKNANDKKG